MGKSDTKNVKLGVCSITFGGKDLGYTKGGVEVNVTTNTHKSTVDQFGDSEINEYIMGRTCKVSAPLAETTLDNLVEIMPGATLVTSGGVKATGTITFGVDPKEDDTFTINGETFTFKDSASGDNEIMVGVDMATSLDNAVMRLNNCLKPACMVATYTEDGIDTITITYDEEGTAGNAYTLATSNGAISAATLEGGVEPKKRVDVTNAISTSLLDGAKELKLHPVANEDGDFSDDFTVPLANTAGQLSFAFKLDEERIYNVEFSAYPDPATKKLFFVGDPTA
jgi:hypothetical protein